MKAIIKFKRKLDSGYKELIINEIDEYNLITFELHQFINVGSEGLHICLTKKQVKKLIKFLNKQVENLILNKKNESNN